MSTRGVWMAYELPRTAAPRRRRWPWWLLALLLLIIGGVAAGWLVNEQRVDFDISRGAPVAIQTALPALLVDDAMVVFVVDDSYSMQTNLSTLHEALFLLSAEPSENTEIALLQFGSDHRVLFDFTEPEAAPWRRAIPAFQGQSRGTAMYTALLAAYQMLPEREICNDQSRFVVFEETVCREHRIVLMSDGVSQDMELHDTVVDALSLSTVSIDTVALGFGADEAALREIARRTGGGFYRTY